MLPDAAMKRRRSANLIIKASGKGLLPRHQWSGSPALPEIVRCHVCYRPCYGICLVCPV